VIAATFAAKNFGELIDRVREERSVYVVERGGVPVVQIAPVARKRFTLGDLVRLLRSLNKVDADYLEQVETGRVSRNRPIVPRDPWAH